MSATFVAAIVPVDFLLCFQRRELGDLQEQKLENPGTLFVMEMGALPTAVPGLRGVAFRHRKARGGSAAGALLEPLDHIHHQLNCVRKPHFFFRCNSEAN